MIIYHNPRCSKSRKTLELLRQKKVDPEIIEYLKNPPSKKTIGEIIIALNVSAHDILRTKEDAYADAGLCKTSSAKQIIDAIVENPILLERPIVVSKNGATIGRPPENVLGLM